MTTLPAENPRVPLAVAPDQRMEMPRMAKHQRSCADRPQAFSPCLPVPAKLPLSAAPTSPSQSTDQAEQMAFSTLRRRPLVVLPAHPVDQMRQPTKLPGYVSGRDLL